MVGGGAMILLAAFTVFGNMLGIDSDDSDRTSRLLVNFQITFWAAGGLGVLALAVTDVVQRRDAEAGLLVLWVLGTFLFTAFCNWTVNGRSILPMAPAVGILIARRLDKKFPIAQTIWPRGAIIGLTASAVLSLLVLHADFLFARATRESAREACSELRTRTDGRTLWFEGHWGFQYYMEAGGARAIDLAHPALKPGDTFVEPANNAGLHSSRLDTRTGSTVFSVSKSSFLATTDKSVGAGFYASIDGPLPFAFGRVPPERTVVFDFNGLLPAPVPPTP